GSNQLLVFRMDNVLTTHNLTPFIVSVPSYGSAVFPTQFNTTGDPNHNTVTKFLDTRILSVATQGNSLVAAQNVGNSGVTHARWYIINLAGASPTLSQSSEVNPGPGAFTYYPSIEINSAGAVGLTYLQSSPGEWMAMYVAGRIAADPANTLEPSVKIQAGQ